MISIFQPESLRADEVGRGNQSGRAAVPVELIHRLAFAMVASDGWGHPPSRRYPESCHAQMTGKFIAAL